MFRLSFIGSFARQRDELLKATSFAPIPLHRSVERQLTITAQTVSEKPPSITSVFGLFLYGLRGIRELIIESVAWNALATLIVLAGVFVAREVFQVREGISFGLLLAAAFLALKILQTSVEYINAQRRLQVHRGLQVSYYSLINSKLVTLSPRGRVDFSKGQLKTLIGSDVESIEDFLSAALQQWIPILVSALILVPALYVVAGSTGLITLLVVLLLFPIAMIGAVCTEFFQKKAQAEQDALSTKIGEWVKNIRLVRYLGWGDAIEEDIIATMRRFVRLGSIRHAVNVTTYSVSFAWTMIPLLTLFAVASWQSSSITVLEIFSSYWILDHISISIQHIPYSLSMYGSAAAGAKRVLELLGKPNIDDYLSPAPSDNPIRQQFPAALILRNVSVRHDSVVALDGLSLVLPLNQKIAVVGSVGSGKTTLLEALIGELPLDSGAIAVRFDDGTEVDLWRSDAYRRLRSLIAYSPQQPFLSNATMSSNIDLSSKATSDDVDMAIFAAQLDQDLATFTRGLDEEVGESGINLSGGQKQRVSLARAFISKRPFLVLDDPLSAVDSRTEERLMDQILARGAGVILVSHRLSELERCDRVLVLERGAVVEDGLPRTLALNPRSKFSSFLQATEEHDH
jgi:ABC-type multidrug transport system fused ATPase/permease subunit